MTIKCKRKIRFVIENNSGVWLFLPSIFIEVDDPFDIGIAFLHWTFRIRFVKGKNIYED